MLRAKSEAPTSYVDDKQVALCAQSITHLVEHAGGQLQELLVRPVVAHQHACRGATPGSGCNKHATLLHHLNMQHGQQALHHWVAPDSFGYNCDRVHRAGMQPHCSAPLRRAACTAAPAACGAR